MKLLQLLTITGLRACHEITFSKMRRIFLGFQSGIDRSIASDSRWIPTLETKKRTSRLVKVISLQALSLAIASAREREFTSADGRKIQAELVDFQEGRALLKLDTGKTVPVPLAALSPKDQEFIDLWATDPARTVSAKNVTMEQYLTNLGCDSITWNDDKSAMIIEMTFASRPHTFIINTNLPYSYLDGPVADVLGLTVKQTGDVLNTIDGRRVGVGDAKLENFTLGKSTFGSRIFRISNLVSTGINNFGVQVDGIIGYDFLQEYGAVLDYKAKKLYFIPPTPPAENN